MKFIVEDKIKDLGIKIIGLKIEGIDTKIQVKTLKYGKRKKLKN